MPQPATDAYTRSDPLPGYMLGGAAGGFVLFIGLALLPQLLLKADGHGASEMGFMAGLCYAGIMVALGFWRRHVEIGPPVPLGDGPEIRLLDPMDGRMGLMDAVARWSVLLWFAMGALVAMVTLLVVACQGGPADGPLEGAAIALAGLLVCLGLAWAAMGKAYRSMKAAGPGEFVVSAWPIQRGQQVAVRYERQLHGPHRLRGCTATLELVWLGVVYRYSRPIFKVAELPLGDGDARIEGDRLTAGWSIRVPDTGQDEGRLQEDHGLHRGGHAAWRVRVDLDVGGLEDHGSELFLELAQGSPRQ